LTPTPTPTATTACDGGPRTGCHQPLEPKKSKLQLKDNVYDAADKLVWKWSKGDGTLAEFGDPTTTTDYTLCVYDEKLGVPRTALVVTIPAGGTCVGQPCWSVSSSGYAYKDAARTVNGVRTVKLKAKVPGNASILIKAQGAGIPITDSPATPLLFAQSPQVTAQLVSSTGACWEAHYTAPALKNSLSSTGRQFKDQSD
jgi:hypothetical protein